MHHVEESTPLWQFLRLRRLWRDDSDFFDKSEATRQFFDKSGHPVSVVQGSYHRVQQIDRQSALQTAQMKNTDRIPFTLTFYPYNHSVKSIILNNFKWLQNDSETISTTVSLATYSLYWYISQPELSGALKPVFN